MYIKKSEKKQLMDELYAVSVAEDRPINKKKTVVRFYLEDLAEYVGKRIKKGKLNKGKPYANLVSRM